MFFMSYLQMFLFIYSTRIISTTSKDIIQDVLDGETNGMDLKSKDGTDKDVTSFNTPRLLFKIIQNLTSTKVPNLKSNVFDKMLSDELLSIKKHFYEKDQNTALVTKVPSNSHTPTIEVKQNWPMIGFTKQPSYHEHHKVLKINGTNKIKNEKQEDNKDIKSNIYNESADVQIENANEKVVGLRSLPESKLVKPLSGRRQSHACTSHHNLVSPDGKMCHCVSVTPVNPHTDCTATCPKTSCSHTPNQYTGYTQWYTFSVPPVYFTTIQPYFIEESTSIPYINGYYHPDVINPLKLPKRTRKKKIHKDYLDLYYNDDYPIEHETKKHHYYDDYEDRNMIKKLHSRKKTTRLSIDESYLQINDVETENAKPKPKKIKLNSDYDSKTGKQKLVQDIFDDLNAYYSDSVVKDCYCKTWVSSSPKQYSSYVICIQSLIVVMIANS